MAAEDRRCQDGKDPAVAQDQTRDPRTQVNDRERKAQRTDENAQARRIADYPASRGLRGPLCSDFFGRWCGRRFGYYVRVTADTVRSRATVRRVRLLEERRGPDAVRKEDRRDGEEAQGEKESPRVWKPTRCGEHGGR
jgi:hypothetical protein